MRTIVVPSGIGDIIWVLQKIMNTGEKFNFVVPASMPRRGHQILDLLPDVVNSVSYLEGWSYAKIKHHNVAGRDVRWDSIGLQNFVLSANEHVENGKRIEVFLPDLPTVYRFDYSTTSLDVEAAELLVDSTCIGVYTSAYGNARHHFHDGWGPLEWETLIRLIANERQDVRFFLIGADYDEDLLRMLSKLLSKTPVLFTMVVGYRFGVVVELLKRLSYFVGFPSGLSILNETLEKDGTMFYGSNVKNIMGTWAHPERIQNLNLKECLFCPPEKLFDWLKNDYHLFQKL